MAQTYGLTSAGFIVKQQNTIITEINTLLQGVFGPNANLSSEAVLGQLVGIFSEREALLWQLLEALYDSEYPSGAEGTSVDNILAFNNLRRLGATATKTAPTSTSGTPGLLFLGTAGTIIPKGSVISVQGNSALQFTTDASVTIAAAVNAVQLLSSYGGSPISGAFTLAIVDPAGNTCTTESIPYNVSAATSQLSFSAAPGSASNFKLTLTMAGVALTTANIPCSSTYPSASAIQTQLQALSGYSGVTVSNPTAGNYVITWGSIPQPLLTVPGGSNTTGVTISAIDSLQAAINNVEDTVASTYPYTDVSVSGTFGSPPSGFTITFGANTPASGQISSGYLAQNIFSAPTNTLMSSSGTVGLNSQTTTTGAVAQGTGSATCTATGPNFVASGYLNVIGSSVSGWSSVTNPLDCITGTNLETDTEALARRATLLAENANGPLQAIVEKVSQVSGVVQAVGYQNLSLAAEQIISFTGTATAGSFTLTLTNLMGTQTTGAIAWNANAVAQLITFQSVPSTGTWSITLGGTTVSGIAYNASAAAIQSAIRAGVSQYSTCTVTGNYTSGFLIGNGPNSLLLLSVSAGSTGVTISVTDSIQAKINALTGYAQAIVDGYVTAGSFTVGFNGSNGGQPQSLFSVTSSLTGVTGTSVLYGLPGKAIQIVVNDNNGEALNSDIAEAIFASKSGGILTYGSIPNVVQDTAGNSYTINFSRPTQVPIYVNIALTTDLTTSLNPQFQESSISTIQEDIVEIGSAFGMGGEIIGFGTNGLIGAFNSVPGITGYTISFGTSASPTSNSNIQLLKTQAPQFESYLVQVTYQ